MALGVHVAEALLDRRADLPRLGVEDLVTQHEDVGLGGDDAARDMRDVADAQLAQVTDVAVGGHADAPPATGIPRAEPQGVEQPQRGVGEAGEVVRHG